MTTFLITKSNIYVSDYSQYRHTFEVGIESLFATGGGGVLQLFTDRGLVRVKEGPHIYGQKPQLLECFEDALVQ